MRTVDAADAKTTFASLLDLVEKGEEITIMRDGKPAARLIAAKVRLGSETTRRAAEEIKEMRKGVTLGGIPIKDLINEGRK